MYIYYTRGMQTWLYKVVNVKCQLVQKQCGNNNDRCIYLHAF